MVNRIKERTDIYPMIYGKCSHLLPVPSTSILGQCDLWIESFNDENDAKKLVSPAWANKSYKILNYTEGKRGPEPYKISGIEGQCHRDKFNGTSD